MLGMKKIKDARAHPVEVCIIRRMCGVTIMTNLQGSAELLDMSYSRG